MCLKNIFLIFKSAAIMARYQFVNMSTTLIYHGVKRQRQWNGSYVRFMNDLNVTPPAVTFGQYTKRVTGVDALKSFLNDLKIDLKALEDEVSILCVCCILLAHTDYRKYMNKRVYRLVRQKRNCYSDSLQSFPIPFVI